MAPARDFRALPRLRPEVPRLRQKASLLAVAFAAGAALVGLAGLLGRYAADAALGARVALGAAALGAAAAALLPAADDEGARAWAAGGALAALAVPALLRFLGLALADPAMLTRPLGGRVQAWFILGQAFFLAAAAAFAWTRATRGGGARAGAAALAGAAAGGAALGRVPAALIPAGAALLALAAAAFAERPWYRRTAAPLRSRLFAAAAAAGLLLSTQAPGLLPAVWIARLHRTYPGGGFLAYADDGVHAWAAYLFSTGKAVCLRDGVVQSVDATSVELALSALLGQRAGGERRLLIVHASQPDAALFASIVGATVTLRGLTPAQAAVFDGLQGPRWRTALGPRESAPNFALIILPRPLDSAESRGAADAGALKALRASLPARAAAAVLVPPDAPPKTAERIAADAAAAFGKARIADLPHATMVLASSADILDAAPALHANLPAAAQALDPGAAALSSAILWRAPSSEK